MAFSAPTGRIQKACCKKRYPNTEPGMAEVIPMRYQVLALWLLSCIVLCLRSCILRPKSHAQVLNPATGSSLYVLECVAVFDCSPMRNMPSCLYGTFPEPKKRELPYTLNKVANLNCLAQPDPWIYVERDARLAWFQPLQLLQHSEMFTKKEPPGIE